MTENPDRIDQLFSTLETLLKRQETLSREISELHIAIKQLKDSANKQASIETLIIHADKPITEATVEIKKGTITVDHQTDQKQIGNEPLKKDFSQTDKPSKIKKDLEKFIGEDLINKIGIAITIIGVAIGAKYSIDHQLISPLKRIILGYLMGLGLLVIGFRLKKKYVDYSAVLVSGAMAIMYFITYAAYSFYDLIPHVFAFLLMLIFTVFTALTALNYNKQVIAHIGLVGAYAVPFLLSERSGKVVILFIYMAIINVGILAIALKRYWKELYYSSFVLTWLIYFFWYKGNYIAADQFGLALLFLMVFFITFYMAFLAYKLKKSEKFEVEDIALLLVNSFIFYGLGYSILSYHNTGQYMTGVFTICNAVIHFIVSVVIYKQKLADRNLFYLVSGLVLIFVTIAVPVQLNGN